MQNLPALQAFLHMGHVHVSGFNVPHSGQKLAVFPLLPHEGQSQVSEADEAGCPAEGAAFMDGT